MWRVACNHTHNCWVAPTEMQYPQIVCGNRAGALTILVDSYGKHREDDSGLQGELRPTFKVLAMIACACVDT